MLLQCWRPNSSQASQTGPEGMETECDSRNPSSLTGSGQENHSHRGFRLQRGCYDSSQLSPQWLIFDQLTFSVLRLLIRGFSGLEWATPQQRETTCCIPFSTEKKRPQTQRATIMSFFQTHRGGSFYAIIKLKGKPIMEGHTAAGSRGRSQVSGSDHPLPAHGCALRRSWEKSPLWTSTLVS